MFRLLFSGGALDSIFDLIAFILGVEVKTKELRNSQGYCTDNECFQEFPGPQNVQPHSGDFNFLLFLMGWMVLALALYFLRPKSLKNRGDTKPSNQGPRNPPPPETGVH
ncbi:small integral membrane protein 14-like [Centruroides sculpturatus]|uniref:small integral membrane protein 14-like n=1 Tax=Centruroides sculpturatus TaxID=218467 RepID=UPI000C6CDACB|nr:small integral membrane protein 14-like [Centruroides sculpturatus]